MFAECSNVRCLLKHWHSAIRPFACHSFYSQQSFVSRADRTINMALPDRTINTTKAAHPPIFVYINGYPGVGKFSVAKELAKLLDNAKVLDNHRLIDTTAMLYERGMPEYQPSRKQLRSVVLDSLASSISTKDVTWIFTDQQSSSANGTAAAKTYEAAAKARGSPFVSVVLHCGLEENIKRLSSGGRGGDNTKLTDVGILEAIRENEDIYHFRNDLELEINVTSLEATAVADTIKDFVGTYPKRQGHWGDTDLVRRYTRGEWYTDLDEAYKVIRVDFRRDCWLQTCLHRRCS